jgi:P-type E1-E2 ATPase
VQTLKAEQSLNSLKQLSAPEAKVMRDGVLMQIPSREVTIGDEVIIEAGDCIPADGKLLTCASLKVDESALTGESLAVENDLDTHTMHTLYSVLSKNIPTQKEVDTLIYPLLNMIELLSYKEKLTKIQVIGVTIGVISIVFLNI